MQPTLRAPRAVEWLRVLVPVLLALFLRWGVSDTCEWKGDEALHYLRASELARGERLGHLVGFQTSAGGAHLPATFHHLLALPCLLGGGPRGVSVAVSVFYALGLLTLLVAGAPRLGRLTTFLAALLLAVPPGLVLRSRSMRNEELLPPLAIGVLLLVIEARASRDPQRAGRFAGLALALGVFATQVHLSFGFLALPLAASLLPVLRRGGLRPLRAGLVLGVVGTLPFLVHELQGGFAELRAALGGLAGGEVAGKAQAVHAFLPFALPQRALGYFGLWEPLREQIGVAGLLRVREATTPGLLATSQALGVGALVAGAALAAQRWRGPVAGTLWLAVAGPWLLYLGLGVEARVPYTLVVTPALAVLSARGAVWLTARHPARRAALGLLLVAPWLWASVATLRDLEAQGGAPDGGYGVAYRHQRAAIDALLARGWRLEAYDSFEQVLLLDVAYRALPPERRAPLRTVASVIPYWELPYLLVFPAEPRAPGVSLRRDDGEPVPAADRFGPLVLKPTG